MDDDAMENYLMDGAEPDVRHAAQADPQGYAGDQVHSCSVWFCLQEQGCSAAAERCHRLSAQSPMDVVDYMGFKPGDETETRNIPRRADDDMAFSGLAFKIMNDPFVGSLTFTRIYSGKLNKGDTLLNSTKGKKERVGRMMMMHSNDREEIQEAWAGDIIALAGLKDTTTGDTLCVRCRSGGS